MLTEVFLHKVYHQNEEERESEGGGGGGGGKCVPSRSSFMERRIFTSFTALSAMFLLNEALAYTFN